ncbi:tetratricopeptide repeat protein [Phenylobacterium sp.]|uniref:tetratricopeptide repeat protein n=1 Tax=Phenylobacterium sp. TaxID=1871053 RepID=UPI0035B219FE
MNDEAETLLRDGDAHYAAGRFDAAAQAYRAAFGLSPRNLAAGFNVGNALKQAGRPREAIAAYDAVLAIAPDFAIARHNRATCLLQVGDLGDGFREYEWRKGCPGFVDDARYGLERPWRGEEIAGKTLFVYPELFQGDLIQFGRYAVMAERLGARVILGAPRTMHALLSTMSPTLTLVDSEGPAPDYDYNVALMTLPAMFGTTLETVPRAGRYLQAQPERVARWRERLGTEGVKVGIAWQGSANAAQRSFPLALAAERLAAVPGVRLISLQKVNGLEQLAALPPGLVQDLGDDFDPGPDAFVDTAAAMMACDLFISADTSVVHVAGGLGRPTWLATTTPADWRWLEDRVDSPWYPSLRIFRQPAPGDWAGLFDRMAQTLQATLAARGNAAGG